MSVGREPTPRSRLGNGSAHVHVRTQSAPHRARGAADSARARGRAVRPARARARQGHRRPAARDPRDPDRVPRRRPLPAARRARAGQDAADQDARGGGRPQVQPHPVHAGPDAVRHPRHRGHRGGSRDRQAGDSLHPRADLREHHSRRRDQPHAAQDAGGAARGDAGVSGHGQRRALRARSAVLRARDAESDRAGRHLSAARGAARSLHVQRRDRLPDRRRGAAHPLADDRQRGSGDRRGRHRATRSSGCTPSCARCRRPRTSSTTRRGWCARRARRRRAGDGRAGLRQAVGALGRRSARRPGAAARREGARAARRPERGRRSRTSTRSRCRCCAIASC